MKKISLIGIIILTVTMTSCGDKNNTGKEIDNENKTNIEASTNTQANKTSETKISPEDYPKIDGSTATIPLAIAMRSYFTGEDEEELKLVTTHTKTSESFYGLIFESTDLLLVYTPDADIFEMMENEERKIIMEPIGKDALVFFTNKDNKVSNLSLEQIQKIYSGEITSWSEVGGDDVSIEPYQRNKNSGSQVMMEELVMKDREIIEPKVNYIIGSMGGIIDEVESYQNTNNALGFSVYYYLKTFIQDGRAIKTLSVDDIEVTNENIKSGKYNLTEDFYVAIREDEPEDSNTRKLFNFILSEEGKNLMEQSGYVPVQ